MKSAGMGDHFTGIAGHCEPLLLNLSYRLAVYRLSAKRFADGPQGSNVVAIGRGIDRGNFK